MKSIKFLFLAFTAIMWVACADQSAEDTHANDEHHHEGHDHEGHDHEGHDHDSEVVSTTDGIHYGETISEEGAVSLDELMEKIEGEDAIEDVTVIATTSAVCQTKGCWMNLEGEDEATSIFVQFKDYGFFVPKDLTGSKVAVKGKAYYDVTSVEDLKHFAEDEGLSQEEIDAITEPKKELKFMAEGVKILEKAEQDPSSEESEM